MPAQATPTILRVPISNILVHGDYTAEFQLGSGGQKVNLLLDTGSSTPAIYVQEFSSDRVTPTNYVAHLAYGSDQQGFTGPVVQTNLSLGSGDSAVNLTGVYIVVMTSAAGRPFGKADGILGLAYSPLNQAYDVGSNSLDFQGPLNYRFVNLPPYFTALEQQGLSANKFSFYTLRSIPSYRTDDPASDPLNQGFFILGGGEEATDLYEGDFTSVKLMHDRYYNVQLASMSVGNQKVGVPASYPNSVSNSIVDSGTQSIWLPTPLWEQVMNAFASVVPNFARAFQTSTPGDLANWPDVTFELTGENGNTETLTLTPDNYWQLNVTPSGRAVFNITPKAPQAILGLPLLNNYFTIFDRSADNGAGVVKFAKIKRPS